MKKIIKWISVLLSVLLICSVFAVSNPVVAADLQAVQEIEEKAKQMTESIDDLGLLYEIESERDRFTKVFMTEAGTRKAIVSSVPVHYESNGKWIDIDNTLSETDGGMYSNESNDFKTHIPVELSSDSEIKIEKDQYSICFELQGTDILKKQKKSKANKKIKNLKKELDFLDKESTLKYESVGESTDIEYSVTATGLKENIILNKKPNDAVVYKYNITVENLSAVLNSDNSVSFYGENDLCVFEIPAPIMFDSEGNVSNDIKVTLDKSENEFILIYEPLLEWLKNEAKYPVTIDPVINTQTDSFVIKDTYASYSEPTSINGSNTALATAYYDNCESISYIGISENDVFDYRLSIKSVLLYMYNSYVITPTESTTFEIVAYPIEQEWSEYTLTYNNRPSINNDVILDKCSFSKSSENTRRVFDVTEAFASNSDKYYGVSLDMVYKNSSTNGCMAAFASSEYSYDTSLCPYFVIEYYETQGVEEQFDYHVQDVGRAGTVYFNDYSNALYIERDELGISGLKMPVQIKRMYNSYALGTISENNSMLFGTRAPYGFGWKTNYNQFIEYHNSLDGKECILYSDEKGQIVYFEKTNTIENGKRKWTEIVDQFSAEKGYTLYIDTAYENNISNDLSCITIIDSNNQSYEFDTFGLLIKIKSGEDNSTDYITISYNNDLSINKITDGVGREYRFSYTEYSEWILPLLTSICAYTSSGETINVKDNNGNNVDYKYTYSYSFNTIDGKTVPVLSTVTYPDGKKVYYNVTDSSTTLKNIDGYAMEYVFTGVGNCVITEKVLSDSGEVIATGGTLTITKPDSPQNSYQKTFTDANNIKQTKQFDLYGRTINIINNDTTNAPRVYSETSKSCGRMYYGMYIDYETEVVINGENLITNSSFDNDITDWVVSSSNNVKKSTTNDANSFKTARGSLAFTGENSNFHYAIKEIEVSDGVSGDKYNFSFFNRCYYAHQVEELAYCSIVIIEARNNTGNNETWVEVGRVAPNPFNQNWQKYSYDFMIDFAYNEIRIYILHMFQYWHTWYDDLSLVNIYKPTQTDSSTGDDTTTSETEACTCEGCVQVDCPCRDCSDSCTLVYCNRGYSFETDLSGNKVTISDGEKEMSMVQGIDGNYYAGQSDLNGIATIYQYDQNNGQLNLTADMYQNITSYSFDAMNKLKSVSATVSGLSDASAMLTSYQYDNDKIKSISHNGFSYNYEYDVWGNPTNVKVGQQSLVSYSYDTGVNRDRINRITYGNGDYVLYTFSDNGSITSVKSYSAENTLVSDYVYTYNRNSVLTKITDNVSNTETRYDGNKTTIILLNDEGTDDDIELYEYYVTDENIVVELLGETGIIGYPTSSTNNIESGTTLAQSNISTNLAEYDFESLTDYFGRQVEKSFTSEVYNQNNVTGTIEIKNQYDYKNLSGNQTTGLVSSYRTIVNSFVDKTALGAIGIEEAELWDWEYLYTYDLNGNITEVRANFIDDERTLVNTLICSYVYDEVGQLVRENNLYFGETYVYVYDNGGNIVQKNTYDYTTDVLGTVVSSVNYSYDNAWGDKLTAYGNTEITTDAIGNPLNMVSSDVVGVEVDTTLEWNGRTLLSATVDNDRYEYSYNHEGLRTKMVIRNNTTKDINAVYHYVWRDGELAGYMITDEEGVMEHTVKMLFDDTGDSIGYELYAAEDNSTRVFFFHKNLQGDITAIFNEMGECVLEYSYDAWGNINADMRLTNHETAEQSAEAIFYTPITYRGYMYDYYTGLYYLQSRYYNPLYGRFLNMDDTDILEKTVGTIHGANLFAYGNNNPVMNVDYTGEHPLVGLYVFVAIVLVIIILSAIKKSLSDQMDIDELEKVTDNIETARKLYNISNDAWILLYLNVKNIIEYGTGVNRNPSFQYYNNKYDRPYTEYCLETYDRIVDGTIISRSELWENMTPERRVYVIDQVKGVDPAVSNEIFVDLAENLYTWGVDYYSDIIEAVADMCGL